MPPKSSKKAKNQDGKEENVQDPPGNRGRSGRVLLQTQTKRQTRSNNLPPTPDVEAVPQSTNSVSLGPKMSAPPMRKGPAVSRKLTNKSRAHQEQQNKPSGIRLSSVPEVSLEVEAPGPQGGPVKATRGSEDSSNLSAEEIEQILRGGKSRGNTKRAPKTARDEGPSATESDSRVGDSGDDEYLYETGSSVDLEELTFRNQDKDAPPASISLSSSDSDDDVVVPLPKSAPKPKPNTGGRKVAKSAVKPVPVVEDIGPFQVRFWYTVQGRERKLDILSTANYITIKEAIAKGMEINVRSLQPLLYKIGVDRTQTTFRELANDDDWLTILEVGRVYRAKQLKKKDGTGDPDSWSVKVKEEDEGKTKASKASARAAPAPPDTIKSARTEVMEELQRQRDREAVSDYGLEKYGHIQVTGAEMEKWVDEMLGKNATLKSPGAFLSRSICKRFSTMLKTKTELSQAESSGTQNSNPVTSTPSFARTFTPAPEPTPMRPLNLPRTQSVPVPSTSMVPSSSAVPSSTRGPVQPRYYPLNTWLVGLNDSRRIPEDATDYSSFLPHLLEDDVQSTFEIIQLGTAGLIGIGPIKRGTAIRLLAWAIEDRDRQN